VLALQLCPAEADSWLTFLEEPAQVFADIGCCETEVESELLSQTLSRMRHASESPTGME
jgi:hypothetical protein